MADISSGGFAERSGDAIFNSAALDRPMLHYRKLHLFRGERDICTSRHLGLPVAATPVGRIRICVCYDLRFIETSASSRPRAPSSYAVQPPGRRDVYALAA